jgi:predicted MFS family arabinose efflux permease
VREVLHQSVQRGALLTVFISGLLCAPLLVFCPVLVKEVFQGDISHFSLAMAAFGVGGLLGGIGLLGAGTGRDRRTLSSGAAITFGVVLLLSAWNRTTRGLPLLFVVAGTAMTLSNASANSMLQVSASPGLRGQTVSLFMLAMRGGMALGGLVSGLSVSALGIREALWINGVLAVLLQVMVARRWSRATLPGEPA